MRNYFFISVLLLLAFTGSLRGNNIVIQDVNKKYGVPKNRVNCMVQDSKGFLWFGMVNGLYKFDLNSFKRFESSQGDHSGFPAVDITDIVEISPGKLMVAANRGLYIFDAVKETFDTVYCKSLGSFSEIRVQSICAGNMGNFWIGTNLGLMNIRLKDPESSELELMRVFNTENSRLNTDIILEIRKAADGTIWFLTLADIGFFSMATQSITTFTAYGANTSIFFDQNNIIQSCFGDGILVFNTQKLAYEDIGINEQLINSKARYAFVDSGGKYWFSISNVGLLLMDSITQKQGVRLISNKHERFADLNSNVIYRIYESSDGAIWLCTEEGISMITLKPEVFHTASYPSKVNQEFAIGVRAMYPASNGSIWMGTVGDGLFQYDYTNNSIREVPLVNVSMDRSVGHTIQAITEDAEGDLWLGTEGDGVIRVNNADRISGQPEIINYRIFPQTFPESTIPNDYVMSILKDKHNNIWVGTWYGLSLFTESEIAKENPEEVIIQNFSFNPEEEELSLSNNTIMSLIEDDQGTIWVGTLAGINRIVPAGNGYTFLHDCTSADGEPIKNKKILDLCQDKSSDIWFSTQDGGICLLDIHTGTYEEFNASNGFHDHIVNSIWQDAQGILWLGTNNGLCRFDPESFTFHMYYSEDGLLSDDFFYRSKCTVDDMIFLGGNKGITYFNPDEIIPGKIVPNLLLTNFKIFNEDVIINKKRSPLKEQISYADEVALRYDQNYITIEFATLNYKYQKEILYSCMLEGLENSWNNLKQERKITYTSLKPGHYTFRVRSYTSGQNAVLAESSLPITIKPPYWRTILAYIFYLVIIVLIVIYSYRYFLNQEKKRHALALERINAKRIHELDMLKLQFYTNISHEFRTPLTLISAPLESLMEGNVDPQKSASYFQLMHKNVQRLRRLINQLLDMRKIEEGHLKLEWSKGDVIDFLKRIFANFETFAERRHINFSMQFSVNEMICYFDSDKLEKVIFNLLSNAFKYTPDEGSISLKFEIRKQNNVENDVRSYFVIEISDTGFGIPEESIRNIYKPFHQVKKNKPIGSAGSGIGLSLTKELVEMQGGEISVVSKEGKGSTFTVTYPIIDNIPSELQEAQPPKPAEIHAAVEEVKEEEDEVSSLKPLLLIVEDDTELRSFIMGELSGNYRVLEAQNGKEGLEKAIEHIPDLIVSDVMMDPMDGVEMCKLIKDDLRTSHIPVILLTARHSEEIEQNSLIMGADDYITKPFNIKLLQARVKNLIEQRRKLRKMFSVGGKFNMPDIEGNSSEVKFIEKLNAVIEENIDSTEFNPVMLASEMALSKMQLYRKVSALTNQTVYNYIRAHRMNKAAQLLISTDMQIAEVAYSVGFSEASNFTKTFSKHFNQTPSQFVRENSKP